MSRQAGDRSCGRRPFTHGPAQLAAELEAQRASGRVDAEPTAGPPAFHEWAEQLVTAKGTPYRFAARPYLREIADVFANTEVPDAVLSKAVQVGGSELLTRILLYMGLRERLTGMYLFPAKKQMADFRDARVIGLIEANPVLKQHLGGVANKGLMRFGASHLYFRGAESIRDVVGVDADVLVFDEYDLLLVENLLEAERRIAASRNPMIRRIGVPSEQGRGIWAHYQDSDQRRWHVSCEKCGEVQTLTFDNVAWAEDYGRIVNERLACRGCKEGLDPRLGRWIASHPERPVPGFHVSRLMVPGVDLKTLIQAYKRPGQLARQKFVTNDLGEPYFEPLAGLTAADIRSGVDAATANNAGLPWRQQSSYAGSNLVTAGVDPAGVRPFRVRISEQLSEPNSPQIIRRALYIGTVADWKELLALCRRYNVDLVCVDAGSERHSASAFADAYGAVLLVYELFMPTNPLKFDLAAGQIKVDRTYLLDATFDALRVGNNLLPEDLPAGYVDEMTSPRRTITEVRGRRQAHYEKRGDDDYAHAEALDFLASTMLAVLSWWNGGREEVEFPPIGEVLPNFTPSSLDWSYSPGLHEDDGYVELDSRIWDVGPLHFGPSMPEETDPFPDEDLGFGTSW